MSAWKFRHIQLVSPFRLAVGDWCGQRWKRERPGRRDGQPRANFGQQKRGSGLALCSVRWFSNPTVDTEWVGPQSIASHPQRSRQPGRRFSRASSLGPCSCAPSWRRRTFLPRRRPTSCGIGSHDSSVLSWRRRLDPEVGGRRAQTGSRRIETIAWFTLKNKKYIYILEYKNIEANQMKTLDQEIGKQQDMTGLVLTIDSRRTLSVAVTTSTGRIDSFWSMR